MAMNMFRCVPFSLPIIPQTARLCSPVRLSIRPTACVFRSFSMATNVPRISASARSGFIASTGILAGGSILLTSAWLGYSSKPAECEPTDLPAPAINASSGNTSNPKSIVNLYQLSFGTVCGLCAGIFIKKGLKVIAFLLGGVYILMQYLASKRMIRVDWSSLKNTYTSSVNRLAGPADTSKSNFEQMPLVRIWKRTVDFLTADFQERATFIAGLVLGLRLG